MAPYSIEELRNIVSPIARAHGVESVSLFGSYAKGLADAGSDVDLKIDKGALRSLFQLCGFRLAIEDALTEEEHAVYKRGRNAKSFSLAKNATMKDYRMATGFEALMGYLYLSGRTERMVDLVALAMTKTGKADSGDMEKQKEENSDEI